MKTAMISRWPVLVSMAVGVADCEAAGCLTEAAISRLFADARDTYFAGCETIDGSALVVRASSLQPGSAFARQGVSVSVGVVEVFDDSFTMTARLRPIGAGDGNLAGSGWCKLAPRGPVTAAMRDEFIALAHAARHFH
jgi:hypothetical protein